MEPSPRYRPPDLAWLARDRNPLPDSFLWGVATAGYQVEGAYNAPGLPTNNWAAWEQAGKAQPAGQAVGFWEDWATHLNLAADMGLSAFRLSIEWTRLQPNGPGSFDAAAVERYADIIAGCRIRGLEPVVTLQHFTHPAWLGPDPWLEDAGPVAFEAFVGLAVPALNRAVADRSAEPIRWWITLNEPNIFALVTYLVPGLPTAARRGIRTFRRGLDGLMSAHVLAYRSIHQAYAAEGWPQPRVTFNTYCLSAYALDRGLMDLGVARELEVRAGRIRGFLRERRIAVRDELVELHGFGSPAADRVLERMTLPDPARDLPRYVAALAAGDGRAHDYVAIDYYVGPLAHYLRLPLRRGWRDRQNPFLAGLWETTIRPEGLRLFLKADAGLDHPLPVLVAENGMATRVRAGQQGRSHPRSDGWTRPAFLRAHIGELLEAAHDGATVAGYLHWTLVDNFEWGSFEPRFGLHGVDRTGERPRILATDAAGEDAPGTYRRIVAALKSGDGRAAAAALTS